MAATISASYPMERKSALAETDMLYNRTGKHAKVAGVSINQPMFFLDIVKNLFSVSSYSFQEQSVGTICWKLLKIVLGLQKLICFTTGRENMQR